MNWSRRRTLLLQNWDLLMRDPAPIFLLIAMPLVMMAFLQGTGRAVLQGAGYANASGAEVVVPGMAVMFAFFGVGFIHTAFFAEHGWKTWDRLRASQATTLEIVMAKIAPAAVLQVAQLACLFVIGVVVFGMQVHGSLLGVLIMILVSIVFMTALSMLVTAVASTANQANAIVNMLAMVLPGLGGALAPVEVLPDWARAIAPLSPAYWMLKGFREVILEGRGVEATMVPAAVVLAFSAALAVLAMLRFNVTDEKEWDR